MKELNEKERIIYEKGFEDGYAIAKRLYKPFLVEILSEDLYRERIKINN